MTILKWPVEPTTGFKRLTAKQVMYQTHGLKGNIFKFTIHSDHMYDFYLQIAEYEDKLDFIAITVSGLHDHNIRALTEVVCREATRALRQGAYTMDELFSLWRGYRFEPQGYCPQTGGMVTSPLDAAAHILQTKYL